jgi:tetratricopeptide (TPR) repeat protein
MLAICHPLVLRTTDDQEALDCARDALQALASGNDMAALYWALWLNSQSSPPQGAVKAAFQRSACLGSRFAREWCAYLEHDPERRSSLLLKLEEGDSTGWVTCELAQESFASGDRITGLRRLDRAAKLGSTRALTDYRLLAAVGPQTKTSLLEQADHAGDVTGIELLARHLAETVGAAVPAVEAAASRADLRGSADAAVLLGVILFARFGAVDVVEHAYARGEKRGSVVCAFNLGTLYCEWKNLILAEKQFKRAIDGGDAHARPALAELLWSQGERELALAEAEIADHKAPTWRSALVIGDILKNLGNTFGAIDCYIRSDARGSPRAAIELAELWPDELAAATALDRAERRLTDDTDEHWPLFTPEGRSALLGRVIQIRERRRRTGGRDPGEHVAA